jgi:hypothetical protein
MKSYRYCSCGFKMIELLGYEEDDPHKKVYHKGWHCPYCQKRIKDKDKK